MISDSGLLIWATLYTRHTARHAWLARHSRIFDIAFRRFKDSLSVQSKSSRRLDAFVTSPQCNAAQLRLTYHWIPTLLLRGWQNNGWRMMNRKTRNIQGVC